MPRYEDDYRPRAQPTARRLEEPVRDDRHRLDRGEARERVRTLEDSHAEQPIRSDRDRDRERIRPNRGERDRGQRMEYIEDTRIGVPRGDPRANTIARREDRERETITVYKDPQGRYRDVKTHELIDVPTRTVPRPRGDDYDDDMEIDRDEPPRRRVPEREPQYYDRKPRGPREDDYDDYGRGPSRSGYGLIDTFVDGAGIEREVIQTDICRYLGNDATVMKCKDGRDGYIVTGYRALTSHQLDDLKEASARYRRQRMTSGSYTEMRARDDRAHNDRTRENRARDDRARDGRARDDRDTMDVEMDYDPPLPRDRHRSELEPRGGERIDRHRMGAVPVSSGYAEPAYALGQVPGPYGAAQRPRTTGNYSPQGGRPGHAGFPSATFDSRTPPVSMAAVPPTTQTLRDPRTGQPIPIEPGFGGGFVPEPARSGGRHGR